MTKLRFSKKFRDNLSEKLMELGNLVAVGLVFGQLLAENFIPAAFFAGILTVVIFYIIGYILSTYE